MNPSSLKLLLSGSLSLPPKDFSVFFKRKSMHNVFNVLILEKLIIVGFVFAPNWLLSNRTSVLNPSLEVTGVLITMCL